MIAFALFYLLPVYLLLITGMKSFEEVSLSRMWDLPSGLGFDSFGAAWDTLRNSFINSFKLVLPATVISCLLGSMNGYVLAKWKFRGSDVLFTVLLFGMFIPYQSILIPLVLTLQRIGLYGSIAGLILVHVVYGIPITTLIFRNYYAGVPTELVEAAKIDGAGFFGIYRHILLPLSIPGFVVVAIWQAAGHCSAAEYRGEPIHAVERPDGRRAACGAAHLANLYLPGALLPAGIAGWFAEGLSAEIRSI
jgi:glucose/mannose transport system permease protein